MLGLVSKKEFEKQIKEMQNIIVDKSLEISRLKAELKNSRKVGFDLNNKLLDVIAENRQSEDWAGAISDKNLDLEVEVIELKKTVKKLKTLCTKNGIDYKKALNKEEK